MKNIYNKRRKNHGGIRFLALTAFFGIASLWQFSAARKELPDIIEWYAESGYEFSGGQLQQLAESTQIGFYVQAQLPAEEEILGSTEEMTVRLADKEYLQWSGIKLEAGRLPQAGEAAVSSDWALAHYKYLDVAGRTVRIDGSKYCISGVYSTKNSWRQRLAGDGADVLYLAFKPGLLPKDYCVNYLYFAKEGADFQCSQSYLEDTAALLTRVRTVPDISLDVESVRHVCMQNIAVCGILWLFLAAVFFGSTGKKAAGYLFSAAFAAAVVFYQWYVPMAYLPKENVFDFAGYIQQYIKGQNLRHMYRESGYFGNLAYIHVWISWGILILEGFSTVCGLAADFIMKKKCE